MASFILDIRKTEYFNFYCLVVIVASTIDDTTLERYFLFKIFVEKLITPLIHCKHQLLLFALHIIRISLNVRQYDRIHLSLVNSFNSLQLYVIQTCIIEDQDCEERNIFGNKSIVKLS